MSRGSLFRSIRTESNTLLSGQSCRTLAEDQRARPFVCTTGADAADVLTKRFSKPLRDNLNKRANITTWKYWGCS